MKKIHAPTVDARYWAAITFASVFGTNVGDLYAHTFRLGLLVGLSLLALVATAIVVAERADGRPHEIHYWALIVVVRTGATNIADFVAYRLRVPLLLLGFAPLCIDSAGDNLASINGGKNALKVNEDAWRANMSDLIFDIPRLNATLPAGLVIVNADTADHSAADGLPTSQSRLSYSFDVGDSHFSIINTDPVGGDSTAPSSWLASDLAAATRRGAHHFFVFGHEPAYTYDYSGNNGKAGGLDVLPAKRNVFWNVIEQYGASYYCGHEHTFNMREPVRSDGSQSTAWQVIVGSGGSPFDVKQGTPNTQPYDRFYSYANVNLRLVVVFAFVFLGERPSAREWLRILMVGGSLLVLALKK